MCFFSREFELARVDGKMNTARLRAILEAKSQGLQRRLEQRLTVQQENNSRHTVRIRIEQILSYVRMTLSKFRPKFSLEPVVCVGL